jgi:hypothetical protein
MITDIVTPELLAYIAGAFYVLGLLIINQVTLRLLVLAGTGFYILYYATVAAEPLWEAIYISLLIGVANLLGLFSLLARNSQWAIPREHKDIYGHFPGLPPGDFRTFVRLAKRGVVDQEIKLTTENAPLTKLYYVIEGETAVTKKDDKFIVPGGTFVGEVAYLMGRPASASTKLLPGAEYLEWSTVDLSNASARSARFKLALESVLSMDLAQKVSRSVAPFEAAWRPELSPARVTRPVQSHGPETTLPET